MSIKISAIVAAFVSVSALCGCSIYPQPDDISSFESRHVSRILRCQMRDAVRSVYIKAMEDSRDRIIYLNKITGTEAAKIFSDNPELFIDLNWSDFTNNGLRTAFERYADVSISWDFTIDSTEMNASGVDVTLLRSLTRGSNSFGITAKNDRTREVKRHFRVFDSWDSLMRKMRQKQCLVVPDYINAVYPTLGLLRFNSLTQNFAEQNQVQNLSGKDDDWTTAEMADTLTFTTKSQGNFDPTLSSNAISHGLVPSQVKFNSDNYRQDIHTIIVLLRLPLKKDKSPRFDERGLLSASVADSQRAIGNRALNDTRIYNNQDDLQKLTTAVQNFTSQ